MVHNRTDCVEQRSCNTGTDEFTDVLGAELGQLQYDMLLDVGSELFELHELAGDCSHSPISGVDGIVDTQANFICGAILDSRAYNTHPHRLVTISEHMRL